MELLVRWFAGAVKVELRRAASMVACGAAAVAGLGIVLRDTGSAAMAAGCLVGGLLAVAALGELPSGILFVGRRCRCEAVVWAAARAVFPLVGVAAVAGFCFATRRDPAVLVPLVAGILATAAVQTVADAAGCRGSEPATAALLVAVGAATVSAAGLPFWWLPACWAASAWAVGSMARIAAARESPNCGRGRGRTVWLWPLPAQGRLRPSMTFLAMLVGLASMAAWLVPQPPMADRYAAIAAVVFIAVAVPQMTLADGVIDHGLWATLLRPRGRSSEHGRSLRGTNWPPAGRIAVAHMALFTWPLVVAGVLTVRLPGAAVAMGWAMLALAGLAAAASAVALPMRRSGCAAETTQATMLAVFAMCGTWCIPHMGEFLRVSAGSIP